MKTLRLIGISFCLSSCSWVNSSFTPDLSIEMEPKDDSSDVQFLGRKPSREAIRIGTVECMGNQYSRFEDLIASAKKKGAKLGGDFILKEEKGVEKEGGSNRSPSLSLHTKLPLSSSGEEGIKESIRGSQPVESIPMCNFSVWAYLPSKTGIRTTSDQMVAGFSIRSSARTSGIEIGDQLLGIDGIDIDDDHLNRHLMEVFPGEEIKVTLLRKGEVIEKTMNAMRNN